MMARLADLGRHCQPEPERPGGAERSGDDVPADLQRRVQQVIFGSNGLA